MTRKWSVILVFVLALVLAAAAFVVRQIGGLAPAGDFYSTRGFVEFPLPLRETNRLFDIGVVDANGDGFLDIYTSNHHFRQVLLLADGKGGYRDVLSEWKLDQSRFPLAELSFAEPRPDRPGVYVYWLGTDFIIRAHRINEIGEWRGSMRVFDPVKIMNADTFRTEKREAKVGEVTETTIEFSAAADGTLVLRPGGQGLPLDFRFSGSISPSGIFVGLAKAAPNDLAFSLAMQDRHALAWADFNGDGVMDLFANRGALAGTLRAYPAQVAGGVRDELFLSRGPGAFDERAVQVGIEKKGCSGRHAQWLDFDGDGLLDLFVNCYDRENVSGDYPKQLYRQGPRGKLRDVAEDVGLGLPDQQMGNLAWFDVDGDGDIDLLAFQDEGLFLYRNDGGRYRQEVVLRRSIGDAKKIGHAGGNAWFFDGKLVVTDYDGDGNLDVFSASKRGNVLLKNERGRFKSLALDSIGLPPASLTANWVDFDNDGLPDLHFVPQGLYRQRKDHTFERTGILASDPKQFTAAIVNWADFDNDGKADVLLALNPDPEYRPWWDFGKTETRARASWKVMAYRNEGAQGHWLQVELRGEKGNPQGIGASVTVESGQQRQTWAIGAAEGSFFSQGHYRAYFGLGSTAGADVLTVRWPDGIQQKFTDLTGDRLITLRRNAGMAVGAIEPGVKQ